MESYDALVIGSGSGASIVEGALNRGMRVALLEHGPLGGTCLNRGCIPSKMVIYPADLINQIREAERLGIRARVEEVDFASIMERTMRSVERDRAHMEEAMGRIENLTLYRETGEFVSDYTMSVGGETIRAENIFIASGARPLIPPIEGLEGVDYITTVDVWEMRKAPGSMIIVGGGFVAAEMAHFFSGVGVEVTVLSRSDRLMKQAEPEVSELLEREMGKRMRIFTGTEVTKVSGRGSSKEVTARDRDGRTYTYEAEALFIAAGRRSNADLLKPERTGVELDSRGFVKVNEYFETSKRRIWAFGDAIGKAMFKHVANREAEVLWHNFSHGHRQPMDYSRVPYAVYSWPQIASVGLTEAEARGRGHDILEGRYNYAMTAKGEAMGEPEGFVKVIVEDGTYRILGAHIIGPYAPILIQEVTTAMSCGGGTVDSVFEAMHIHPALPEVVQGAFYNLHKPGHVHA